MELYGLMQRFPRGPFPRQFRERRLGVANRMRQCCGKSVVTYDPRENAIPGNLVAVGPFRIYTFD